MLHYINIPRCPCLNLQCTFAWLTGDRTWQIFVLSAGAAIIIYSLFFLQIHGKKIQNLAHKNWEKFGLSARAALVIYSLFFFVANTWQKIQIWQKNVEANIWTFRSGSSCNLVTFLAAPLEQSQLRSIFSAETSFLSRFTHFLHQVRFGR